MTILDLANILNSKGYILKGCSINEVKKIEKFFNVSLPETYIQFLLTMGKNAGDFMKGSSVFYDEIFNLREDSVILLEENNFISLPENAFVFWMHQGYQFAFFEVGGKSNPPVYFYYEGQNSLFFDEKEPTFINFLISQLEISGI